MSIKKCFRGFKNREVKALFDSHLQSGMSEEDAAIETIKIYGNELSKQLTALTGRVSPVVAGSYNKITKTEEVTEIKKEQKVRIVDREYEVQTTKGLRNRAFNLFYKSLTSPVLYNDLMTSIDNDTMKDSMTSLLSVPQKSDFGVFSPLEATDILFQYKAGAAGIGEWANSSNDHIRSQDLGITVEADLGNWGNTNTDQQYSEALSGKDLTELVEDINAFRKGRNTSPISADQLNQIKIADSMSELINAFVDIANEDAYVTRANWGSLLNGYGGLLLRAGVHPYKVSAMFLQPAMSEFIQASSFSEGIIENKPAYEILDDIMKDYQNRLIEAWETENDMKVPEKLMQSIREAELSELYKEGELRNFREMAAGTREPSSFEELKAQYMILNHYRDSLNLVKRYNASVTSSKWGENGAGSNPSELLLAENKLSYSFTETEEGHKFVGLENKYFDNTGTPRLLMKFYQNTAKLTTNIFNNNPELFFGVNESVFKGINKFSDRNRVEPYLSSLSAAEELLEAVRAMSLSGFEKFNIQYSDKKRAELVNQILELKENKENVFAESLFHEMKDGQVQFYMNRVSSKDGYIKDMLSDSWQQLLDDPKTKEAGEFLIAESYRLSGFRPGPGKFYELIPYRWLIENNLHNYVEKLDYDSVMSVFPQQFAGNYASENFLKRANSIKRQVKNEDGELTHMEVGIDDKNRIGFDESRKFPVMPMFMNYRFKKAGNTGEFTGLETTSNWTYKPMQLVGFKKIHRIVKNKMKPTYRAVYKVIPKLVPEEADVMSIRYDIDKGNVPLGEGWKQVAKDDKAINDKISTMDIPSDYWKELGRKDLLMEQIQRMEIDNDELNLSVEEKIEDKENDRNKNTNC